MAASINRVVLVGNLTRAPELAHTQSGVPVCTLRLAVNGREKVGDQWRDRTDYFDVTVWDRQAESCDQYLDKGYPVGIDGRLRLETWEKDGQRHSRIKVVADNVQFLPRGRRASAEDAAPASEGDFATPDASFNVPEADFGQPDPDDIPF